MKKHRSFLFFFNLCLFVGLVSVVLKEGDFNNYQFFSNFLMFFSLILALIFIDNLEEMKYKKHVFLFIIIVCCMSPIVANKATIGYEKMDQYFSRSVLKKLNKKKQVEIICMVSKDSFNKTFYDWYGANKYLYLKQLTSNLISFSIGNPEVLNIEKEVNKKDYTFDWVPVKCWRDQTNKFELSEFMQLNNNKYLLFYPGVPIPSWIYKNNPRLIKSKEGYIFVSVNFNQK